MKLFYSEHNDDLWDVDLQMLQAWLVVSTSFKNNIVSAVLFHKYRGANVTVRKSCHNFLCSSQPRSL